MLLLVFLLGVSQYIRNLRPELIILLAVETAYAAGFYYFTILPLTCPRIRVDYYCYYYHV